MTSFFKKIVFIFVAIAPLGSFAANTLKDVTTSFVEILWKSLLPLLFSIALALFVWGVTDFIRNADNPDGRKKGKTRMIWGIIGLLAMIGYLSLTAVFTNTFFGGTPGLPQLFPGQ